MNSSMCSLVDSSNTLGALTMHQAPCWAWRTQERMRQMSPCSQRACSLGGVNNINHMVKLVIMIMITYTEQHADTIIGQNRNLYK